MGNCNCSSCGSSDETPNEKDKSPCAPPADRYVDTTSDMHQQSGVINSDGGAAALDNNSNSGGDLDTDLRRSSSSALNPREDSPVAARSPLLGAGSGALVSPNSGDITMIPAPAGGGDGADARADSSGGGSNSNTSSTDDGSSRSTDSGSPSAGSPQSPDAFPVVLTQSNNDDVVITGVNAASTTQQRSLSTAAAAAASPTDGSASDSMLLSPPDGSGILGAPVPRRSDSGSGSARQSDEISSRFRNPGEQSEDSFARDLGDDNSSSIGYRSEASEGSGDDDDDSPRRRIALRREEAAAARDIAASPSRTWQLHTPASPDNNDAGLFAVDSHVRASPVLPRHNKNNDSSSGSSSTSSSSGTGSPDSSESSSSDSGSRSEPLGLRVSTESGESADSSFMSSSSASGVVQSAAAARSHNEI